MLEPIVSSTPVKNIKEGDKVRINTTDVRSLLVTKGYKIDQCVESPPGGQIRNYFYENPEEYICGRWVFQKVVQKKASKEPAPEPEVKKQKNTKKKVASSSKV